MEATFRMIEKGREDKKVFHTIAVKEAKTKKKNHPQNVIRISTCIFVILSIHIILDMYDVAYSQKRSQMYTIEPWHCFSFPVK